MTQDMIIRIAAKGDGITASGRHVPMSAPGDSVGADGTLIAGPHRQQPPCRHFGKCGGCQLQHVDDAALADFVRDRVVGALAGQGITPLRIDPVHLSPPLSRRRVALKAQRLGGRLAIGFAEQGSHRLTPMVECPIMHPGLFALIDPLRRLLDSMVGRRDSARISMTLVDQGVDMLIEGVEASGLEASEKMAAFGAEHALARLSLDGEYGLQTWWEPEPATVTFGGHSVAFPANSFLQATTDGERALVDAVSGPLSEAGNWADLFCGLGTFALAVKGTPASYAAEASRAPLLALQATVHRLQLPLRCDHRDLFRRPLIPVELNGFQGVLLDPPRAGAREQIAEIARSTVPVIAYVSCNPSSFARDAATLCASGYTLASITPVGQFRWSTHVELAGIFRRG